MSTPKQENVIVTVKELKWATARMSNWKAAGPDHIQGFWFQHLYECVNAGAVPTHG